MDTCATVADWLVAAGTLLLAFGTLLLAVLAIFQPTVHGWVYRPKFQVSIKGEPPDCVASALTTPEGRVIANAIWLRLWVENVGNAVAKNVEVYARELLRRRADRSWERVIMFPPMNLKWANMGIMYFPSIAPQMGKHCDVGHIVDPACRANVGEHAPRLALKDGETSLAFDLISSPNHKGHIIGPGEYHLDILVAAENALPLKRTVAIVLKGAWHSDEGAMLRDGVGVSVE